MQNILCERSSKVGEQILVPAGNRSGRKHGITNSISFMRGRDRHSIAELNQIAVNYIGKFMDDKLHINVGFNVGLTKEKIVGALIHCIPYIGFPRVLNALTLVKEVA